MKMGEETRRSRFTKLLPFLFLAICAARTRALSQDEGLQTNVEQNNAARVQRDLDGVTTVLLVSARPGKGAPPLGLLTKTARTFVQDGASTEYATQVLGTTLANGRLYARILATSSRVFYDRDTAAPESSSPDPYIVYPSRAPQDDWQFGIALDNAVANASPSKPSTTFTGANDTPGDLPPALDEFLERENDVFAKSVSNPVSSVKFRPSKVRSNDNLPTYTVKQDAIYVPETSYTKETPAPRTFTPRTPKFFGAQSRPELKKPSEAKPPALAKQPMHKPLGTVTYYGFADFTTTVGDTVIVFSPSTAPAPVGRPATTIKGDATLRPDDGIAKEIQATSVVIGHWKTDSSPQPGDFEPSGDPLLDAVNGGARGSDLQPSHVTTPEPESMPTASTPLLPSPPKSTGLLTSIVSTTAVDGTTTLYKSLVYGTYVGTDYAQVTHTASDVYFFPDEASVTFGTEEPEEVDEVTVEYTEPESTSTEQITPEMNELTTPFKETTPNPPTTLKQAQETLAREEELMKPTEPMPTQTSGMDNEIPNDIIPGDHQGRSIPESHGKNIIPVDDKGTRNRDSTVEVFSSSNDLLVPSTVYKTFTYFTTFYIPEDNDQTTTSVRSREFVSTEVSYVTKMIAPSVSLVPDTSTTQASTTLESQQPETTTTETTTTTSKPKTTTTGTSPTTTPKTGTSPATTPITTTTGTSPATTPKTGTSPPATPETGTSPVTTSKTGTSPATTPKIGTSPATTPETELSSETTSEVEDDQTTKQDEEIELIFKTLYTTYTYLTTFFQEETSSVSSREVVETNVITQTVGPYYVVSEDVAGLFDRPESALIVPSKTQEAALPSTTILSVDEVTEEESVEEEDHVATTEESGIGMTVLDEEMGNTNEANLEPTPPAVITSQKHRDVVKTYFTTYTYFTTIFVDDETEIETRTEVYTNVVTGGIQPSATLPTTQESQIPTTPEPQTTPEPPKPEATEKPPVPPEILAYLEAIQKQKSQEEALQLAKKVQEEANSSENPITESTSPTSLQVEEKPVATDTSEGPQVTPNLPETPGDGEVLGTMVTDVVSTSSSGGGTLVDAGEHRINTFPEDQELSESNNHEVEPAVTLLLQTSYTTFTYFTTMYKGDASNVVSSLDTVTNVVTETIRPSAIDSQPVVPTSTAPATEFTTFTYWTTFYKGGDTITTSREETVSNVITPGIDPSPTTAVAPLPSREFVVGTKVESDNDVLDNEVTSPISLVASELPSTTEQIEKTPSDQAADSPPVEGQTETKDDKSIKPEPTTFYTTFTYFTTSYVGNSTVLNSRLETITSVAVPKDRATGRAIGGGATAVPSVQALDTQDKPSPSRVTGLISTVRTSEVTDGTTTHFATDLYGTYIDGLYAQVVESSTRIEKPEESSAPSSRATPVLPTGVLSLNRGSIIDADEISTVYFTTRQVGTIVDGLYAKIVESTSSTKVDEERRATLTPTQTGTHRTGLVRLIEGYIEANETTIFYRSKVIGTSIEGRYAQIIESTSSWLSATPAATVPGGLVSSIAPSATDGSIATTSASFPTEVHPSPAVVQSSMSEDPTTVESSMGDSTEEPEGDEEEEEGKRDESDDGQKPKKKSRLSFTSRARTFTPVIRPFASRNRPTFNPKNKGIQGAATITRTDITPTVTATLAGKGNRFASSRGRLNSPSGAYSSTSGPQLSGSKRFSGRRGSSILSSSPSSASGYPAGSTRGRGSPRISPSSVFPGGRGRSPASIGRGSSVRPGSRFSSSVYPGGIAGSSRFRPGIRASSTLLRGQQPSVRNEEPEDNANDDTATTLVTEETPYTEDDRYYTEDGETGETGTIFYQTTTESSRRSTNPLLKFRRPLTLGNSPQSTRLGVTQRTPFTTTRRTGNLVKPPTSSLNRPPFSGGRTSNRPNVPISIRPRQGQSSLFPPRGLFNRRPEPTEPTDTTEQIETLPPDDEEEEIDEDEDIFDDEEPIEEIVDNDYEGSEQDITAANRRSGKAVSAPNAIVRIRPFAGRIGRVKRQTSQLRSLTTNRFRRPGQSNSPRAKAEEKASEVKPEAEEVTAAPQKSKPGPSSRYGNFRPRPHGTQRANANSNNKNSNNNSNHNNKNKSAAESTEAPSTGKSRARAKARTSGSRSSASSPRIKPSATSNSGRQFTLREKDSGSSRPSYKRPSSSSSRSRPSSSKTEGYSRPRPPRIRGGGPPRSTQTEAPATSKRLSSESRLRPSSGRLSGSSRGRRPPSQRNRGGNGNVRDEPKETYTPPESDGTITVTHYVPTEATIALINNGVTERKNVVTAQPSTEILGPDRYNTVIGGDGRPLIVIAGDVTGTNEQGLTEVTRFLLHESVTTSITRGPTSIGGRRTTFSHIIPSTVYSVENVVSTQQPATPAANAPLANILLSQLLLGQLGQGNPLLGGLQPQQQPAQQVTPSTRYDTRTTSYVTTITKHQSTVIPLTFRGKEILTTLVDSTVDVITATEFITDTIVVTPTATLPSPDINSLLLLLQQPQQPQPQIQQPNLFDPLFAVAPAVAQSNTLPGEVERRYQPVDSDYKPSRDSEGYEDRLSSSSQEEDDDDQNQNRYQRPRGNRNGSRNPSNQRENQEPVATVDESTVVTLYVSGRRPGEFSTVLTTVKVGEDPTASRRRRDVDEPSPAYEILATNTPCPSTTPEPAEGIQIPAGSEGSADAQLPTQSLESVVGDVGRHISSTGLRHFQEATTPFPRDTSIKLSSGEITVDQIDEDDNNKDENKGGVDYPRDTKVSSPNVEVTEGDINSTALNRPKKRLRIRIPISRVDGNRRVTVVRRRPLKPLSSAQQALPAPRRFIVTRVRAPIPQRVTKYKGRSQNFETESEPEIKEELPPRHRVTVTRRRKIQPTTSDEIIAKSRVTRKKLVNVRPVSLATPTPKPTPTPTPTSAPMPTPTPTPTPTSTVAIITTGFYKADSSGDEDSRDEAYDEEDEGHDTYEYSEQSEETNDVATPPLSLDESSDTVEKQSNEIASEDSETATPISETPTEAPVILTDHFFLPSDEEDEDYYEENFNPLDSEETTATATEETKAFPATESAPTTLTNLLEPSPSVSVLENLPETNLAWEDTSAAQIPSPDFTLAINSLQQSELNIPSTNSLRSNLIEPSETLNLNDVTVHSPEGSESTSTYAIPSILDATRMLPSVSSSILEDSSAESIDHPLTDLSTLPSPDLLSTSENPTPTLASEITASVYYSETVVTSTRLRTYTYVVTKLNGLETEVTSSTAVRPKVTTLTLTIPITATPQHTGVAKSSAEYFSPTPWASPSLPTTAASLKPNNPPSPVFNPETIYDDESAKEEPEDEQGRRFNLATRIMSNGVEVIVAGSTPAPALRWETASPPATITLSDAVVMLMPRDKPQEFVTKTCATTFTYLATFTDQDGSARVSTRHQVVYNTATEERRLPVDSTTSGVGLTLEASPTLGTEVFETTYAYLDLPVDSRGTTVIRNTVTAPQHYLDLVLEPSEAPFPETNTYLSTRTLERTVTENGKATVHAVNDIVTRLVVTESARSPRPTTSVHGTPTDLSSPEETPPTSAGGESEIVKTYFVTYSYSSTFLEHGSTVVRTTVATSAEVVTEKIPEQGTTTMKTPSAAETHGNTGSTATPAVPEIPTTTAVSETPTITANIEPIQIFATRTYLTTYTYFTTLLLPGAEGETSTSVSSRSRIVMNVVTESTAPSLLDTGYMNVLLTTSRPQEKPVDEPSDVSPVNNVVTGSTIIFFDEEDRIDPTSTSTTVTPPSTDTVPVSTEIEDTETRLTTPSTTGEDVKNPDGTSDAPPAGGGSFGSLGPFGTFGINGLSALGPVITAMAGLLQGKTAATRRNGTSDDAQDRQDATTPRSPIYIPVAEFADGDIETAESQNIGNRLANLNRNYIPETRHKSSASLANGIPISPGEVITANSDVIIGKPGKIGGPRPPQSSNLNNAPGGIRPPPLPPQPLLQPAHFHNHRENSEYHNTELQILPARQVFEDHLQVPVEYGASADSHQTQASSKHSLRLSLRTEPNHNVMVNDPLLRPPASPGSSNERVKLSQYADRNPVLDPNEPDWSPEKYRRPWSAKDPLKPVESLETSATGSAHWIRNDAEEAASSYSKVQGPSGKPNSWSNDNDHQLPKENRKRPPWAQRDPLLPGKAVLESSLQPKVSEPPAIIRHVVPHVIDRDTGQPLLVNIQPSQVANVVIPQGGNQALIFGDTNEPHITGQYFDDPSPYPEPEVAPGFVGIQKVEHAPQFFGQNDPSEYMVPPPSPQVNFKPLPQSPGDRPSALPERTGYNRPEVLVRPGTTLIRDYNQVQRRPTDQPMTSPPRRTEVEMPPHRYILLGRPGDSRPTNVLSGDGLNWKLKGDRKPATPQPTTQSANRQRPSGHFGSVITKPTMNHPGSEVYMGRPDYPTMYNPTRKPQYPSAQPPSPSSSPPQSSYRPMMKKPDFNLVPPDRSPPMNPFIREPQQSHGPPQPANDIVVTITESVPIGTENTEVVQLLHPPSFQVNLLHDSETAHYHPVDKMNPTKTGATESSAVQQSTGENIPTGAVEYHDPSTDPKAKPEDTSYYPRVPTVKPEVQSLGQIIPQDEGNRIPETWMVNTQTERSSLTNDSEISESNRVRIQAPGPMRGDMTPEPDTDVDVDSESNEPVNFVTPGTKLSFDSVGSVTTVVGKPIGVEQGVSYGHQQQKQQEQGHNDFAPNGGAPFAHRDREPAIVQGVPFRQDQYLGKRPYEGPMIVQGKPFGVYVDGHVNVARPYGNDQRETRRPIISHDVIKGVPFGYHGNQKAKPQPVLHDLVPPPRTENNGEPSISTPNPLERRNYTDSKPSAADGFDQYQHQYKQQPPRPFTPNRQPEKENEHPQPIFTRPEIVTVPPQPSPALSPPAEPDTKQDFVASAGNQSHSGSMGLGNYYENESGTELNLAESTYLLPHSTGSSAHPRPEEKFDSFTQKHPTYLHDGTRPKPPSETVEHHQQQPLQPAKDRVELEFSMPVEAIGNDNKDSDTQTERPPSMFLGTSTTTRKTPTQLADLPTSLAAPPPATGISINRDDSMSTRANNSFPVTQEPHMIPQSRPRPRVPYRDMMPPPLRPTFVFHNNKGNSNNDASQSEGLQPPPLPTEVVGLSPPPPKYIPLEESTTTSTRPFLVELLSQDMVPPAPVAKTSSRPVQEVPTVRPAVAVSGSIRIASATATSHVPVIQNGEADIPIVHGTVDLPVIIENHGPPPLPPSTIASEAKKSEHVSIYTAKPFESKPVSRISIKPTNTLSTSLSSSNSVMRPVHIDHVEPSRSSTSVVTVRPTRLPSSTTEVVADVSKPVKRPGGPGRPVFLQPSKDTDTASLAVEPTQFLTSVNPVETAATTNSPTKTHVVWPSKISIQIRDPEIKTTVSRPIEDLPKRSNATTEAPRNETERETVLYVVTKLGSASSSTRTVLLTRTLTSTTVETVTETLLHSASPTTIVSSSTILRPITHEQVVPVHKAPPENESIFVVMSDQKPPEPGAEEVEAEYGEEEAEATRDEQDPVGNEIHRVLAGGILGAPVFPHEPNTGRCLPECRASKAEVCLEVDNDTKCVCRPGFARMFPDRPCKPIYTYTLRVGLDRLGRDPVSAYAAGLNDTTSNEYQKLAGPTKEALDRTMMQSDLRDVYRGLDVARFNADPAASVEFHVQLSENANETRLKEVVRKYLVGNNYSLGGTEVYASDDLETVDVQDFDECATEEGGPHHDCSPHAACFNLRGSYQCSCREGWADLSDNLPAYPGRICSQAPLGCTACNNKGHCVINTNGQEVCECFPWHGGQRCQVNLKVLLITLVTTGIVLLALLGICVGLACIGKPGRRLGSRSGDRRAMITGGGNGGDTSSEGSAADLATIPHHVPHVLPAPPQTAAPAPPSKRPSGAKTSAPNFAPAVMGIPAHPRHIRGGVLLARPRDSVRSNIVATPVEEQRDRSLTVMIPRAKYRSIPQSPQSPAPCKPSASNLAVDERKLISYLEGGPRPETRKSSFVGKRDSICKEMILDSQQGARNPSTVNHPLGGALVSAGFQVSATVTRPADAESTLARSCGETTVETSTKILRTNDVLRGDQGSTLARSCGETTIQAPTKLLRLDLGEAGSTLARSCGETTIQPPTKLAADRRSSREPRDNASDGHTMAERDVGGTLRMPAQRPPFFDPDRASDRESNFDSL